MAFKYYQLVLLLIVMSSLKGGPTRVNLSQMGVPRVHAVSKWKFKAQVLLSNKKALHPWWKRSPKIHLCLILSPFLPLLQWRLTSKTYAEKCSMVQMKKDNWYIKIRNFTSFSLSADRKSEIMQSWRGKKKSYTTCSNLPLSKILPQSVFCSFSVQGSMAALISSFLGWKWAQRIEEYSRSLGEASLANNASQEEETAHITVRKPSWCMERKQCFLTETW